MKAVKFKELKLCSFKEKKARTVMFSTSESQITTILGENDTGKSCLIKSLYHTLGAEPQFEASWKGAAVKASLQFTVDDNDFTIMRDGDIFTLFHGDQVENFTNVTNGLGPRLSKIFDFNLQLIPQSGGEAIIATPAFAFLPFYLDQDKGWSKPLASFKNLGQFKSPKEATVNYHTGIKPKEYFEAYSRKHKAGVQKNEVGADIGALDRILIRHRKQLSEQSIVIDPEEFQKNLEKLVIEANNRQTQVAKYKKKVDSIADELALLKNQKTELEAVLYEKNRDFNYSTKVESGHIICPTCQTIFENDFNDRMHIAKDLDQLEHLHSEVVRDEILAAEKLEKAKVDFLDEKKRYAELRKSITQSEKQIQVSDALKSAGLHAVVRDLDVEISEKEIEFQSLETELKGLDKDLRSWNDPKKKETITSTFYIQHKTYLDKLNVRNYEEDEAKSIYKSLVKSGSDEPRAIAAYFFAILHTIRKHGTSSFFPIVIDSPNQQDQDDVNLQNLLEVIKESIPKNAQLILGMAKKEGVQAPGTVFECTEKDSLLSKDEFVESAKEFERLLALRQKIVDDVKSSND